MKKMITAAIGGALLTGALLGGWGGQRRRLLQELHRRWVTGVAPLAEGDDGYEAPRLDRDEDGTACEIDPR